MMYETIPILQFPLPNGGSVAVLVESIGGATTNTKNPEYTDVYIDTWAEGGITLAVNLDTFASAWSTALLTPLEDYMEIEVELDSESNVH